MHIDQEFRIAKNIKAAIVSVVCPSFKEHSSEFDTERSLKELQELLKTLGVEVGRSFIQRKKSIDPATFLGAGKLLEIAQTAKEDECQLLVFDFELTSGQVNNIKKLTGLDVVDRNHVILEIFSLHAQTKEAKIQIEVARLQYLLPRLSGFWGHFSRQRGGIGVRGGEGEQQIELDRRMIRKRIAQYKKELEEVKIGRQEQRKGRVNKAVTAALVGYTNAGKSSLLNRLCKVQVLEENKLFATLDSTYRMLNPDTHPPMILIDTVGFLSNLPNTLIDGFRSTLESAREADLLLVVCDVSDPHYLKHLEVTKGVLEELEIKNKDQIIVFNKKDLLANPLQGKVIKRAYPDSFLISSHNQDDIRELREHIINYFLDKQHPYDLFVPYDQGHIHATVMAKTNIITSKTYDKGIFYRIRVPDFMFQTLQLKSYILGPDHPYKDI